MSAPAFAAPCCSSPVLAQLTDDNGDGRIDAADVPDVLFLHFGARSDTVITALDGQTGAVALEIPTPVVRLSGLAVADLDRDGEPEILAVEKSRNALVAFDRGGAVLWQGTPPPGGLGDWDVLGIADLDQDGSPEIYSGATVFDARGGFLWQGTGTTGSPYFGGHISNAADVDPASPGLELLAGPTLYAADGRILWSNPAVPEGWTVVADMDGDGDPEAAVATLDAVYLLDHTGALLDVHSFAGSVVSVPAAADTDGDGLPELIVTQESEMRCLGLAAGRLTIEWTRPIVDASRMALPSTFDFDGDGREEIVHHDEESLRILDGSNGASLFEVPLRTGTGFESPVVADIDGDCAPEIVVSSFGFAGSNLVRAYSCDGGERARPVWNQHSYHVTNIEDDLSVPVIEAPAWRTGQAALAQVAVPDQLPPDLGNCIRAVRAGAQVALSWPTAPPASSYSLYRFLLPSFPPTPPLLTGLTAAGTSLPDVTQPPALYCYRLAGASCSGREGPAIAPPR